MKKKKVSKQVCSNCKCKDEHISDLQKTVEFLKTQLSPQLHTLPTVELEANYALDGGGREEVNVPSKEEYDEKARIDAEATAILSGDYEGLDLD